MRLVAKDAAAAVEEAWARKRSGQSRVDTGLDSLYQGKEVSLASVSFASYDLEIALPGIHLAHCSVAGKSVLASVACRRIDTSS